MDPAPAFNSPVLPALQPRPRKQTPCSPSSPQMDHTMLFQSVARISSPHARQITSCLSPSCSRQYTKSIFALARTLTLRMEVTGTRQRVSVLLSYSQAISGGFQCGAHIRLCHDRDGHPSYNTHCACTMPDKVAGTLQTFRLSLLILNVKLCRAGFA
jgi:hypothetical protein